MRDLESAILKIETKKRRYTLADLDKASHIYEQNFAIIQHCIELENRLDDLLTKLRRETRHDRFQLKMACKEYDSVEQAKKRRQVQK